MSGGDVSTASSTEPLRNLSALNVRDFLKAAVREVPDRPFLVHEDLTLSYHDFDSVTDTAAALWQAVGVKKGDRVAFMLDNCPEFLYAWLGLAKIGAILVAINTRWQAEEVKHFLEVTDPEFALVGDRFRDVFATAMEAVDGVRRVFSLGPGEGYDDFSALMREGIGHPLAVELRSDDLISFISTSGTTGRPKAVMQTHGNFVLTGEGYATWIEFQPGERMYVCLPLFHINSQAYSVMGAIAARGTVVLVERFSASRFWSDMKRYDVNLFNYIGSMVAVLLQRDPAPEEREHSVRLTYGGPAFLEPLRGEIEQRFNLTLISGIGMSENTYELIESVHGERRSGSLGKPRQHPDPRIINEARVVDDDGNDVSVGQVGELIFRNPVLMKGYFRDPGQTEETIRDGWLYTGDLVRQDEDGFFYFVDRKKDIIRVRGENVSSSEVEGIIVQHPDVQEAAVVGIPSVMTDEDVVAFVIARPGCRIEAHIVTEWCRERLAAFKVPRQVWFVETFPKTETQRVEKHRLRDLARAGVLESDVKERGVR